MKKRFLSTIMFSLALFVCLSISAKAKLKPVKLNKSKVVLGVGDSSKLKIKNAKKVKWSSNNTTVATVKAGKITAKKIGTATITAKARKKKYKCNVVVTIAKKDKVDKLEYHNNVFTESLWKKVVEINQLGDSCGKVTKDYEVMKAMFSRLSTLKLTPIEQEEGEPKIGYTSSYYFTMKVKNGSFINLMVGTDSISYEGISYKIDTQSAEEFRALMQKYGEIIT